MPAVAPPQYGGLGAICPQKNFQKINVEIAYFSVFFKLKRIGAGAILKVEGHSLWRFAPEIFFTVPLHFLPRNALMCICAVLGSHVVRLSVRLSVTLVICDHIGWKS